MSSHALGMGGIVSRKFRSSLLCLVAAPELAMLESTFGENVLLSLLMGGRLTRMVHVPKTHLEMRKRPL